MSSFFFAVNKHLTYFDYLITLFSTLIIITRNLLKNKTFLFRNYVDMGFTRCPKIYGIFYMQFLRNLIEKPYSGFNPRLFLSTQTSGLLCSYFLTAINKLPKSFTCCHLTSLQVFCSNFRLSNIQQSSIINKAYEHLVFAAITDSDVTIN